MGLDQQSSRDGQCHGQADGKGRALSGCGIEGHRAFHLVDIRLDDIQAHAAPGHLADFTGCAKARQKDQ